MDAVRRGGVRRVLLSLAATVALAGCWYQPGFGPHRSAHNNIERGLTVDNVDTLAQSWSVDLGDGAVSDPVVSRSGLHAVSGNVVHTRKLADGAALWSDEVIPPMNTEGPNLVGAPSVRGSQVLLPAVSMPLNPRRSTGVHGYEPPPRRVRPCSPTCSPAVRDGRRDTLVGNTYAHRVGFDYYSFIDVHD